MSYEDSPINRRRGAHYDDYARSKYGSPRDTDYRGRPHDTNGYPSSKYGRDDRSHGSRSAYSGSRYPTESRDKGSDPTPKPSRVLGVFGLSLKTEERHLYDIMSAYGPLEDIQIVYDNLSGRSRGFGFVYFQNLEDARNARTACSRGLELHDRTLRVDYSITSGPHQPTPGVYMGKDKRRGFPDRGRRFGYSDSRRPPPRSYGSSYRGRSRSPPPRRRNDSYGSPPPRRRGGDYGSPEPYRRRSRVVSSSRSRSPPPIYGGGRETLRNRDPSSADRFEDDRFPPTVIPKSTREWSSRSGSSR